MISSKLIFMVLAIADFVVNMEVNMYIPPAILNGTRAKGIQEEYQSELLEKFLEKKIKRDFQMNFGVTQISALTNAFYKIRYVKGKLPIIDLFKYYFEYIKEEVGRHVEFSNVRKPRNYCDRLILPPSFSINYHPNITLGAESIEQSHQTPTPSHSVDQRMFYNFLEQPSSSSGVRQNIDLNKPPPEDK